MKFDNNPMMDIRPALGPVPGQLKASPVLFDFPNSRANVFLMMRFQDTEQNREIHEAIKTQLAYYGLNLLRADEKNYAEWLWDNVRAYMDACAFGIAVFEQIDEQSFNPNVSLELGYMLAQDKPVLLLKQEHLPSMPSDVVGRLYRPFDAFRITKTTQPQIRQWLQDIGVAKCSGERLVIFVSRGGTCRCAMAKVALNQALRGRHLPYRLRVESVARSFGGINEASKGARRAVFETYGADYLQDHRVTRRSPGLLGDADLVLVMESKLKKGMPSEHTFMFNEFFGLKGDVPNPWPDDEDDAARTRYRSCMSHLKSVIEHGLDRLIEYLDAKLKK
jgi:protein-tyrosine-phosphatase/nucleoside 2-deoxyribosyltransferase